MIPKDRGEVRRLETALGFTVYDKWVAFDPSRFDGDVVLDVNQLAFGQRRIVSPAEFWERHQSRLRDDRSYARRSSSAASRQLRFAEACSRSARERSCSARGKSSSRSYAAAASR